MKLKRILAILAIIILVAMYVATLVLAFCDFPGSKEMLAGFILLDIAVPIMLWICLYLHKRYGSENGES